MTFELEAKHIYIYIYIYIHTHTHLKELDITGGKKKSAVKFLMPWAYFISFSKFVYDGIRVKP